VSADAIVGFVSNSVTSSRWNTATVDRARDRQREPGRQVDRDLVLVTGIERSRGPPRPLRDDADPSSGPSQNRFGDIDEVAPSGRADPQRARNPAGHEARLDVARVADLDTVAVIPPVAIAIAPRNEPEHLAVALSAFVLFAPSLGPHADPRMVPTVITELHPRTRTRLTTPHRCVSPARLPTNHQVTAAIRRHHRQVVIGPPTCLDPK
jgi:hypothetical protein